ncbi:MAG: hypothetical protein V2B18_13180 [Pseudomonadota bacterium]
MAVQNKDEITRFVADLKQQDPAISWAEVSERVKQGFPDANGVSLSANALRKRYRTRMKESESCQSSEIPEIAATVTAQANEGIHQEAPEVVKEYLDEYVREVIERVVTEVAERVIQEKISNFPNVPIATAGQSTGYPPAPPLPETVAGTRRHIVTRRKLSGTVDAALWELSESERKERGYNVSRMLDVVFWNYFGIGRPERPRLSFELSESSEDAADE